MLDLDPSHVESLACTAAHHFYSDQPEVALRYYRRLLQQGVDNTELWSNIGLCCFYAGMFDMSLGCFEKALAAADDRWVASCTLTSSLQPSIYYHAFRQPPI